MYQQDRGYRTNEPIGKAFTSSCLGKIVILGIFLLIALIVAYFTTPTEKEMLAEMDDNIIECLQANDSIKGDPIDDYVNNMGSIVSVSDSTQVSEEVMKAYRMYNKLEAYRHTFYATARLVNNMHPDGVRVGIGLFGLIIPTVTYSDLLLDVGPVHKGYNQKIIQPTVTEPDLGSNPNIQEFHYKRNPDD